MSATVLCGNCGQQVPIPEEYGRGRMRCPECGVMCDVPARRQSVPVCPECGERLRVTPGKPLHCERCSATRILSGVAEPRSAAAVATPPADASAESLTNPDEGDDTLYQLPSDPEQKEPCAKCNKLLPRGAIVCNHCGFNRDTGTMTRRVHEQVHKEWQPGLRLGPRFAIFVLAQGLIVVTTLIISSSRDIIDLLPPWLVGGILWAYILGTYPRLTLERTKKGRVRIKKRWRVCFIPLSPADLPWRGHAAVVTSQSHHAGFLDWLTVAAMIPFGIIPAILWWFYVVRPDQFDVTLTKDHGCSALLLFRGSSEAMAEEIAASVRGLTGLR